MRRQDTQLGTRREGLLHEALMADGDDVLVAHVAPFIRAGLDEGPTMAVLNRRHWSLLREELGGLAKRVSFADCDDFYVRHGYWYGVPVCDAYDVESGYCDN